MVCISLLGSSKEWSVSMPDTEEILCVMAASGLVACATNARLLRLFTPMGTQRQVVSLAGPVVALAGFSSTVMTVYHTTDPGLADQHLAMDIVAVHGQLLRSKTVPVPLTPSSKLCWLGATDAGSPCTYDNDSTMRMYDITSGVWIPICDTSTHSKGVSDTWFIVSVSEKEHMVRGILCRGASFPATVPKPTILQLPVQLPFCEMDTEKSQYEEQLVQWTHMNTEVDTKAARETALKLFALACRSELEQRALELMELLKDNRLLPLAAKYASRLGRMHLADKLTSLSETWEQDDQMNVAQTAHFHEIDKQASFNATCEDANTSLILQPRVVEKKETVIPIKPASMKGRNPFKKQQAATKAAVSPLSITGRVFVQETDGTANKSTTDVSTENNTDPINPQIGETFADWFARNRETLEIEHPDLMPAELTKQGVRTYRSLQDTPEGKQKRKRDMIEGEKNGEATPVTSVPKQSKLSSFAFQKKS